MVIVSMAQMFLHTITFISILVSNFPQRMQSASSNSETLALLAFRKNVISDPLNVLTNWTENSPVCNWTRVSCSTNKVSHLDLSNARLSGTISPQIGDLRYLRYLNLSYNNFSGHIPLQLSFCSSLDTIDLQANYLDGSLPSTLYNLSRLDYLDISHNHLSGSIPSSFGNLDKLSFMDLSYNILTGTIPVTLSNCSLLNTLNLDANILSGSIPEELGRLQRLEYLTLGTLVGQSVGAGDFANNLTGTIPASLSNCSNLRILSINRNKLSGTIPDSWFNLKLLQNFSLWQNDLTGTIPVSLSNCTQLLYLDLGDNSITGSIPPQLGHLANLDSLHLGNNQLSGHIPASLGNCTKLQYKFWLHGNNLTGQIPDSIWTLYKLTSMIFRDNYLAGEIPPQVGNLSALTILDLHNNSLSGNLPSSLGQLKQLQALRLDTNNFEGPIPETLGLCTQLSQLHLQKNKLNGQVPFSLGNLTQLTRLSLHSNSLHGNIPDKLGDNLQYLYLQENNFAGTIPNEIAGLSNLLYLDLSNNLLYGAVPRLCGSNIFKIMSIRISNNALNGSIPDTLANCANLQSLDLSSNNISGTIPTFLGRMEYLAFLNLSNNLLSGSVPDSGIFLNKSGAFLNGNPELCGTVVNKICISKRHARHLSHVVILIIVVGIVAAFLLVSSCILWYLYRHRQVKNAADKENDILPSHMKFGMDDLSKATDSFSDDNVIGAGGFSIVYKGIIKEKQLVAIKKLKLTNVEQSRKGFFKELETLGKLKHRNLVKIFGYCNTSDMMAIVLEFLPNGSLKDHLYERDPALIDWKARLNIAIGVAQGLAYLHHEYIEPIAHCDIKPENILLDNNFEAHLADFGIAALMDDGTMSSFGGSIGYMAPEICEGRPTQRTDVYSYGILLVELVTRKRPTDEIYHKDGSIQEFVHRAVTSNLSAIVDEAICKDSFTLESINKVLEVAARCLTYDPRGRPSMRSVLSRLLAIQEEDRGGYTKDVSLDVLINEPSPYPSFLTGNGEDSEADQKSIFNPAAPR